MVLTLADHDNTYDEHSMREVYQSDNHLEFTSVRNGLLYKISCGNVFFRLALLVHEVEEVVFV